MTTTSPDTARCPDAVTVPSSGRTLRVRRAWPRSDGHVLLELGGDDGSRVAGQWFADRGELAHVAARTPAPGEAVPESSVLLQPDGADHRLPALATLLRRPGSSLVAHRPGRRAVVRMPEGDAVRYAKVVRRGRSLDLVAKARLVDERAAGVVTVPRLVRHHADSGVLVWSEVAGPTLHEQGTDRSWPAEEVRRVWNAVGVAVRRMHNGLPGADLPRYDACAEYVSTVHWLYAAERHGLLPPVDVDHTLAELRARRPGSIGVLHRDLHDKQLVLATGRLLGLLDLDTLAVGERALDVANLLGHLELRVLQGLLLPHQAEAARDGLLTGCAPDAATLSRIPAYLTATRLRLAGVYAFRPLWRSVAHKLLGRALRRPG
ncbi:MAG: hypothetical protein GEV10_27380 [Streptosporangiales bacterium]|nr:hypothetical protein [Streptosporangiales bacterium]